MAKKPRKIEESPEIDESSATLADDPLAHETIEDYLIRMDMEESAKYQEWLKADPRNPRRIERPVKFSEHYDPNMGVN